MTYVEFCDKYEEKEKGLHCIDLIYEEKEAFEMEVEPLSDSLFCIANDLQDLIVEIINSKRLNRDRLLKTLRVLQRQAEDDSGK